MNAVTFTPHRSQALRQELVAVATGDETRAAQPRVLADPRSSRVSWARRHRGLSLAAAAAASLLAVTGAGLTQTSIQSAQASSTLASVADLIADHQDPVVPTGSYLRVTARGEWPSYGSSPEPTGMRDTVHQTYVPSAAEEPWVLYLQDNPKYQAEIYEAPAGQFMGPEPGDELAGVQFDDLPRDGAKLYALVDGAYNGGSASRAEDNFVKMTDVLSRGTVPADLRGPLLEALSMVPGVTVTMDVATLDGQTGIAIGRTEPLRVGQRSEIIIHAENGRVIGTREVSTQAVFGWGSNEVTGQSAYEYDVVGFAPEPNRPAFDPAADPFAP